MNKFVLQLIGAVVGFLLSAVLVGAVFLLIHGLLDLFDVRSVRFRIPVAFVFLPLIGLYYGWKSGPTIAELAKPLWEESTIFRAAILLPVFWVALVLLTILLFEPDPFRSGFGYMRRSSQELLLKLLVFPPFVIGALFGVYRLIKGRS